MNKKLLSLAAVGLIGSSASLMAGPIPYPNAGTYNSASYSFTATGNGPITAYFYGASAGYGNLLGLNINGVSTGIFGLQDNSTAYGTPLVLGNASAGDILTFVLLVDHSNSQGPFGPPYNPDDVLYSTPGLNADGLQHIYTTGFTTDGIIPSGTYVGFEDIDPATNPPSDLDYNDEQFVFTDVTQNTVPDGGMTISMLGMAFAGLGWLRRKA
jgi:Domain of unknown function (DUF4114)/VPDSG-CTERM motif